LQKQAEEVKPVMITPARRLIHAYRFPRLRQIADSVGAVLFIDMAHIAGLLRRSASESDSPRAVCHHDDTQKSARPRGALLCASKQFAKAD